MPRRNLSSKAHGRTPPASVRRVSRVALSTVTSAPRFPLEESLEKLAGTRRLLVFMHDNPDPDALAAG